ncbi:DUF2892 domain-containing protein [Oceaniovalibus sp. ACAM 378]|uniref:YgaP family membrane protein n=1 Tax=Oceaniovalibus sp. ACAM 378 TaxID=2599923 RepID=UPI0011D47242|nr:DUF2892 domain-containing protein [Oceaniovalibus sp. ACAM 378]TYB87942.1 DUF2892 domain-containing protein [Oceaniovalibus sp. ACAM 378]
MTKNMGNFDRGLRIVVGIALLIAAFATDFGASGWLHWTMIAAGGIFVVTALISTCPLYAIFGIRTCQR